MAVKDAFAQDNNRARLGEGPTLAMGSFVAAYTSLLEMVDKDPDHEEVMAEANFVEARVDDTTTAP